MVWRYGITGRRVKRGWTTLLCYLCEDAGGSMGVGFVVSGKGQYVDIYLATVYIENRIMLLSRNIIGIKDSGKTCLFRNKPPRDSIFQKTPFQPLAENIVRDTIFLLVPVFYRRPYSF